MSDSPSPRKMTPPPSTRTQEWRARTTNVARADETKIRRLSGRAYLRLRGTIEEQARTIGRRDSQISRRRAGEVGLASSLLEIYALERDGYDTTSMAEAVFEVQAMGRAARGEVEDPKRLALEEAEMNAAEMVAQDRFIAGVPGAARQWLERLTPLRVIHERVTRVLVREVAL